MIVFLVEKTVKIKTKNLLNQKILNIRWFSWIFSYDVNVIVLSHFLSPSKPHILLYMKYYNIKV